MINEEKIDLNNIWLSISAVARLKNIQPRALKLQIQKYVHRTIRGRGGANYEIKASSIEPEFQAKFVELNFKKTITKQLFNTILTEDLDPIEIQYKQEKIIPEKMKKVALARLDLINLWVEFKRSKKNKRQANKDFFTLYNIGELSPHLFSIIGKTSIGMSYPRIIVPV